MALLEISEPESSSHRIAVGIDLGTTNTLVAVVRNGVPVTLKDAQGGHSLPSVVRFLKDGTSLVGEGAVVGIVEDPENTIFSAKRLLGRAPEEVKTLRSRFPWKLEENSGKVIRLSTGVGSRTATDVSAEILGAVKSRAEEHFGGEPLAGAVITVPAYFNDAQRQATKDAARLAGINVLRLLNEPTSAAMAYGLDTKAQGTVLVYDLGGGTFDVSILRLEKGVFRVLATGGDTALGGDDIDRLLAEHLLTESGIGHGDDQSLLRAVEREARKMKELLSDAEEAQGLISFPAAAASSEFHIDRKELNALVEPLIQTTVDICLETIVDAGLEAKDIDELILVGGSTRIPLLRQRVSEALGKEPLQGIDPDQVVSYGAAIHADVLIGNRQDEKAPLLLDVIPLSLGLETMGGLTEKLIMRNSTIPCLQIREYTTQKDGQTAMSFHVVQGDRELASDCRSLARFELRGIPPLGRGQARVRITFQVDADALLSVLAEEKTRKVKAEIEVIPSYGLNEAEIETMLKDSFSHSRTDAQKRKLVEQRVEATRVLEALASGIQEDGELLLSPEERENIFSARDDLQEAVNGNDPDKIRENLETLELSSEAFVARRMNRAICQVLKGKSPDAVKNHS